MNVSIVTFPQTRVAGIRHAGHPSQEHETARKLVAWKLEHRLLDQSRYRSYGLHYTDPDPHSLASTASTSASPTTELSSPMPMALSR